VTINIDRYGNTTAGTVPLCLWDWEDKFKKGDNIILAAFGAGFNYGSAYIKWAY
jgi:3-oxoacyl-[acyl-carrier-protein] synthase-3